MCDRGEKWHFRSAFFHGFADRDQQLSEAIDRPQTDSSHNSTGGQSRDSPQWRGGTNSLEEAFASYDCVLAVTIRNMLNETQQQAERHPTEFCYIPTITVVIANTSQGVSREKRLLSTSFS
jgi:hypothetical protein